ncbi:MAG: DUF2269 domain-containing protein [Gallionella sp.]|nr:DUF2269 domain-containing protein [Gallionella sp.]
MNAYLWLKWAHILSSVLLVGVGFGSAFYLYFINRTRNVAAIAEVSKLVVRADYWFTTPAILIQPATGAAMVYLGGYSFHEPWLLGTYALFVLAGISWLPVVWMQIQMAKMACMAMTNQTELPSGYWRYARLWERLGMIAFPAMLIVYGLMVFKPTVW